jgi:hypothetical protein
MSHLFAFIEFPFCKPYKYSLNFEIFNKNILIFLQIFTFNIKRFNNTIEKYFFFRV